MKLVINKCFGGFGVSHACLWELIQRKAACVKVTPIDEYFGKGERKQEWLARDREYLSRSEKPDPFLKTLPEGWQASFMGSVLYDLNAGKVYGINDRYDAAPAREDPDLVALVEERGSEWASSSLAKLEVVSIPDGVDYEIDEYDGIESVHEKHRVWG